MSKQIIIEVNRAIWHEVDIQRIRHVVSIVNSIVAPLDIIWEPIVKPNTSAAISYHIDRNNDWWADFDGNRVAINSRYGSDELMDAIGVLLLYRLPHQWEPKLVPNL